MAQKELFIVLVIISAIIFCVYSWFVLTLNLPLARMYGGQEIFSWPDEMANNFFINNFVEKGNFVAIEELNLAWQNIIHPRSTNVLADVSLVPTTFLGFLMFYGWLSKLIGVTAIKFLTPLAAALTPLFFWGIVRRVFNESVAFISSLLLFLLAPFWYFANLTLLPNVFFIFCVIASIYFLIRIGDEIKVLRWSALAGFFMAAGLIIRPIEFIWLGLIVCALGFAYKEKLKIKTIICFLIPFLLVCSALLYYNWQTYGNSFSAGYMRLAEGRFIDRLPPEFNLAGRHTLFAVIKTVFLPFGFHPYLIAINLYEYFVKLLWPYFIIAIAGFAIFQFKWCKLEVPRRQKLFFVISLLVAGWLAIYYASWQFNDTMILKNATIGSSYTRYFLPVYILTLPYIGVLFYELRQKVKGKVFPVVMFLILTGVLSTYSFWLVYFTKGDGLIAQRLIIRNYYKVAQEVERQIPAESMLIVDRTDKLFFPKRKVIIFNLDYSIFPAIKANFSEGELYYLTTRPQKDIDYINEQKIRQFSLKFALIKQIDNEYDLYVLTETQE